MYLSLTNIEDVRRCKAVDVDTMRIKGYELIKELFVDSSGFGRSDEPALTYDSMMYQIKSLIKEHGRLFATITNQGQFQVYIGLFKKSGVKTSKRIANNTLEHVKANGDRCIRLHQTDVVTFKANGDIVLDSGGWQTVTTKARINEHIPQRFSLYQHKFEWFVTEWNFDRSKVLRTFDFKDGMILPLKVAPDNNIKVTINA